MPTTKDVLVEPTKKSASFHVTHVSLEDKTEWMKGVSTAGVAR